jgi:hypothetical protein
MDVIGWGVPEGSKSEVRYRVFKGDLEPNTPQPMLLIEFLDQAEYDWSVHPSADFRVILAEEETYRRPVVQVLGGFLSTVDWVFRQLDWAFRTGESPFPHVPEDPTS